MSPTSISGTCFQLTLLLQYLARLYNTDLLMKNKNSLDRFYAYKHDQYQELEHNLNFPLVNHEENCLGMLK